MFIASWTPGVLNRDQLGVLKQAGGGGTSLSASVLCNSVCPPSMLVQDNRREHETPKLDTFDTVGADAGSQIPTVSNSSDAER